MDCSKLQPCFFFFFFEVATKVRVENEKSNKMLNREKKKLAHQQQTLPLVHKMVQGLQFFLLLINIIFFLLLMGI